MLIYIYMYAHRIYLHSDIFLKEKFLISCCSGCTRYVDLIHEGPGSRMEFKLRQIFLLEFTTCKSPFFFNIVVLRSVCLIYHNWGSICLFNIYQDSQLVHVESSSILTTSHISMCSFAKTEVFRGWPSQWRPSHQWEGWGFAGILLMVQKSS